MTVIRLFAAIVLLWLTYEAVAAGLFLLNSAADIAVLIGAVLVVCGPIVIWLAAIKANDYVQNRRKA